MQLKDTIYLIYEQCKLNYIKSLPAANCCCHSKTPAVSVSLNPSTDDIQKNALIHKQLHALKLQILSKFHSLLQIWLQRKLLEQPES
nr:hypothetical protein Iba_chr13aCG7950 [Ipomoea batatas]